jgi:septal ring factor EnvC (AmiA/AmiB activator)
MKRFYLITEFLILTIFISLFAQPKKSDELKSSKKQIENEIANTDRLLKQTQKNTQNSLEQLAMLRQQISNREELITALNKEMLSLEEELEKNIKLSQSLDKKLEYMKADYSRVVYLAYKNRKLTDKISFLLSAEDFTQMYQRFKYYSLFADNVKYQVKQIAETKEEIARKNQDIFLLKEEKIALLNGKEREIKKLENDRIQKSKSTEELKKKEKQLMAELAAKQKKRNELDAAIKKAIQEEIAAANTKNAKKTKSTKNTPSAPVKNTIVLTPDEAALNDSFVSNQGKLPWPVLRGVKVSDFGNYPHPDVPSVIIENKGIDILVEDGMTVRSVFEGEVTGILDVFGTKVLMIRHGEYLTVYQNLTNVLVKKGDKVKTKQAIAAVAKSTNNSTSELHFEVWKNNVNLNPSLWLVKQ